MNSFTEFEIDIMETLLKVSDNEFAPQILKQYRESTVIKREFTGVGFFTEFSVADKTLYLPDAVNFELGSIHATVNNLEYGAGFILFIREGVINLLEGHSYGGEKWPEIITDYKYFLINEDGSLTGL